MSTDRYARGIAHLRRMQHEDIAASLESALQGMSPSYAEHAIGSTYGDVYQRDGLDLRSRQLATIAILATLGGCDAQLRLHVQAGLNLGLTGDEIVEVIVQVFAYAGAPRGSSAMYVAGEVFAAEGVTVR
jgi:4-carboxymuconolactone decarboxylase